MDQKVENLSVVIPVYNDQEVIQELYRRLHPVLEEIATNYEVVLVDDGSKDDSWNEILRLRDIDEHIVYSVVIQSWIVSMFVQNIWTQQERLAKSKNWCCNEWYDGFFILLSASSALADATRFIGVGHYF